MTFHFFALSGPEFADIRSRVDAYAEFAAYDFNSRNLARDDGEAERVLTMGVTAGFFDVLGAKPVRGRTFTDDEAQRREGCFAVLGYDLSERTASGVGSTIRLDDAPCDVIGVMPEGFAFRDDRVKVWTALPIDTEERPINRQSHGMIAVARLREGVTAKQADAQLQSLRGYWSEQYPDRRSRGRRPLDGRQRAGPACRVRAV
jgi:hypothetical protein